MRKYFRFLFFAFVFQAVLISSIYAEEKDPLNTLDAINHAIVSIYRVERNPSQAIVEEEYDDIINNVAWGNITADPELLNLFTEMMNAYTENRLDAKDREMLRKLYEVQVNRAFLEVKPIEHIKNEAKQNTAREVVENFSIFNPASWIGSGVRAGLGYGEYQIALQANERMRQQAKGQEQEYMQQLVSGEWELDKAKIRRFNQLKTSLLNAAWPLLNRYNLPDQARITESDLDAFYSFGSEKDVTKAIRMGERLKETFSQFAPYWFYLGAFYLDKGEVKKARECFEKFEEVNRPIQRKDTYAAANARYKIFTLDKNETREARRLLDIIEKQSLPSDWNNILFAALQNYQLGDKNKAEELLYQNIDRGFNAPLNEEILTQIKKGKFDLNSVKGVLVRDFKDSSDLELLAESGDPIAQYNLGKSYLLNLDINNAIKWFRKSANQDNYLAQGHLILANSNMYDKEVAKEVFERLLQLAEKNDREAQNLLGYFFGNGFGTDKDLDKSFIYFKKSADQGDINSLTNIAKLYLMGEGVDQNKQKGVELLQQAANKMDYDAIRTLGMMYYYGMDIQQDYQKAYELLYKCADLGDPEVQAMIAQMYLKGEGVKEDINKAVTWYEKSSEKDFPPALVNLGVMYANGEGVKKDFKKAFELYSRAAEKGDNNGQLFLGYLYINGDGVEKDIEKAKYWLEKSKSNGNQEAENFLKNMK